MRDTRLRWIWVLIAVAALASSGCSRFLRGEPLLGSGGSLFGSDKSKKEKVVKAERLELVDQDGNVRARLFIKEDGDPAMIYIDKYGTERALVGLEKGKPTIRLIDENEEIIWAAP